MNKNNIHWIDRIFLRSPFPFIWIILIGFLLYFQTLFFDYVYLDDTLLVEQSLDFLKNIGNIFQAFQQEVFTSAARSNGIFYRPILTISYILDAQLTGTSLVGYHLTNILIHLVVSCLIFVLLTKLNYSRTVAFILSLFFVVHPALVAAIAWLPGRNDTLLTLFIILSFIFFTEGITKRKFIFYILHLLLFTLALLTKETALVLPVLCTFYLVVIAKKKLLTLSKIFLGTTWLTFSALLIFLRGVFVENVQASRVSDAISHFWLQSPAVLLYIGKIILPINLSTYPNLSDATFIYGIITIGLIAVCLLISKQKRKNLIAFGLLWFLLFLLPTFTIREKYSSGIAREHRLYLPLIGMFFVFAEIDFIKKADLSRLRTAIFITIIIFIFTLTTFFHSKNFRNSISFWQNATHTSPSSSVAHINLGAALVKASDYDRAQQEYKKALVLEPNLVGIHNNLGVVYLSKNMLKEAEIEFKKELEINPTFEMAKRNLDLVSQKQEKDKN